MHVAHDSSDEEDGMMLAQVVQDILRNNSWIRRHTRQLQTTGESESAAAAFATRRHLEPSTSLSNIVEPDNEPAAGMGAIEPAPSANRSGHGGSSSSCVGCDGDGGESGRRGRKRARQERIDSARQCGGTRSSFGGCGCGKSRNGSGGGGDGGGSGGGGGGNGSGSRGRGNHDGRTHSRACNSAQSEASNSGARDQAAAHQSVHQSGEGSGLALGRQKRLVEKVEGLSQEDCAICLSPITRSQLAFLVPCLHRFCYHCIRRWLHTAPAGAGAGRCPLCKARAQSLVYSLFSQVL
jgi:hypothetical protein